MELDFLREQMKNKAAGDKQVSIPKVLTAEQETLEYEGSEKESDASDEDEYVDDLPVEMLQKRTDMRTSVSAEAYGVYNPKGEFKPPSYPKSPEIAE